MGNGGSTKKCRTEKKCSYFTLEVFENYLMKLDFFCILLCIYLKYFNSSLLFCGENNTKMFCIFLALIVPHWPGTCDAISYLDILR